MKKKKKKRDLGKDLSGYKYLRLTKRRLGILEIPVGLEKRLNRPQEPREDTRTNSQDRNLESSTWEVKRRVLLVHPLTSRR
jgi:hypothetical protein